jgi:hypothetical protein
MSEHLRAARPHEREALEALQLQASLMWEEDRAALLANLDAIDLPPQQITDGDVFVCESGGEIVGFGVVLRRDPPPTSRTPEAAAPPWPKTAARPPCM